MSLNLASVAAEVVDRVLIRLDEEGIVSILPVEDMRVEWDEIKFLPPTHSALPESGTTRRVSPTVSGVQFPLPATEATAAGAHLEAELSRAFRTQFAVGGPFYVRQCPTVRVTPGGDPGSYKVYVCIYHITKSRIPGDARAALDKRSQSARRVKASM